LNADKIETSVLDTDTALTANSDLNVPSQRAVKAYVDAGGNVNASETTKGIVEEATDAEVTAGTATGGTGAKLFVTPAKLETRFSSKLKFGGTGADGALTLTSGATNIDCASAAVVVKNYTSISITGTGSLTFTNPHVNGTVIVLKANGAVTLTSSITPMIDVSSMGATGGSHPGSGGNGTSGDNGFSWNDRVVNLGAGAGSDDGGGGGGSYYTAGSIGLGSSPGAGGAAVSTLVHATQFTLFAKVLKLWTGGGGGEGASTSGNGDISGNGGRGGGALYIECGGAFNFTTTSGVSVGGANGTNASSGKTGGGGGGGGGSCIILYNTLTANSGTITVSGGSAGTATGTGSAGGAGGAGLSLVAANTEF